MGLTPILLGTLNDYYAKQPGITNKSRLNNDIISNIQICSRENHTIHELSIHVVAVHNIMYTVHISVNVLY